MPDFLSSMPEFVPSMPDFPDVFPSMTLLNGFSRQKYMNANQLVLVR